MTSLLLENPHISLQSLPDFEFHDIWLNLPNKLHLPARIMTRTESNPNDILASLREARDFPIVIIAHGLGARNPGSKDVSSDEWIPMIALGALSDSKVSSVISYTARGHGKSYGWQENAESDPDQFTWPKLAQDMKYVVDYFESNQVIVGGSSMGSATSLYLAINHPELVKGVIMIRPPTAWETRKERRKNLLGSAENCRTRHPTEPFHFVLSGTAYSDFPPLDDLDAYRSIRCPVLILAVSGDDSHPLSTAESLASRIPRAQIFVVDSLEQAYKEWPSIIGRFISEIIS